MPDNDKAAVAKTGCGSRLGIVTHGRQVGYHTGRVAVDVKGLRDQI
ncbi:MAG: hypothetical protein WDN06_15040 [Asticcacaulis sp.]